MYLPSDVKKNQKSLKSKAAKGLFWSVGERLFTQGGLFVISLVLARILSPTEYGTLAMLLVFVNLADILVTNGLGESLIQCPEASRKDFSTIFFCGFALSIVLYAIIFFSAPAIGDFYGDSDVVLPLRILALRLPFSSLSAIQRAYVSRNFLFRKQFFASFIGSFMSGIVAIALASLGAGLYALIAQQFLNILLCSFLLAILCRWLPGVGFSMRSVRRILPLGLQFAGANFVNSLYTEGRALVIGKFYSSADLAYYNRGNQFPSLIVGNINTPISNVMLPVMSSVNNDKARLRAVTRKAMQLAAYVIFPAMGLLASCAEPLVRVLLTDKWIECVPYLQVLCAFYLFQPLQTMNWQALKAAGKGALCLKLEVVKKVVGFAFLFVSIPFGVMAIALSGVLSGIASMLLNMAPNARIISYTIMDQIHDMAKPFVATVVMCLGVLVLGLLPIADVIVLSLQFIFGVLVYLLLSRLMRIEGYLYLVNELKSRCGLSKRDAAR